MNVKIKDSQDTTKRLILLGLSQRGFAKKIGISGSHLSQIISGKRTPSPEIAKKICDGLGVAFDDIFFIQKDNKCYQTRTTA